MIKQAMTVVLAGGSGFLGNRLRTQLERGGHRVLTLTRSPRDGHPNELKWQPDGLPGQLSTHLEGTTAVVNLAGENIAGSRWTEVRKAQLRDSRILPTQTLVRAISECERPPGVLISGSAVGYYGPRGDELVTERTPAGDGFLARLCVDWEHEARAGETPQTRLVILRTGVVLGARGGALKKMLLPFKLGLGATLGSGDQYMPWIHVDDWVAMVIWLIGADRADGVVNASAPAVTNRHFTRTLGHVLRRPAVLQVPAFVLKAGLGEMADMLLTGQRVVPTTAEDLGFRFAYRELEPALRSLDL